MFCFLNLFYFTVCALVLKLSFFFFFCYCFIFVCLILKNTTVLYYFLQSQKSKQIPEIQDNFSYNLSPTRVMRDSITQIVDLMEGLRCSTLPLACERIVEVQYRDWLLAPSLRKDGSFNQRKKSPGGETAESESDDSNDEGKGKTCPLLGLKICTYTD